MAPRRRVVEAVLLTPGAGGTSEHHVLTAIDESLAKIPVRRMDFPYRLAGRRAPDRAPVLVASIRAELESLCQEVGTTADRVVLGGRSMGGRMCSMAVAEGLPAAGVILLSYPLHPPKDPQRWRTEHFERIDVPCLFISGQRDPFGSPEELAAAAALIPAEVTSRELPGGHDPKAEHDPQICEWVGEWIAGLRRPPRRASRGAAGRRAG